MSRQKQLDETVKKYSAAFKKHGSSPKSLLWRSSESARLRYEALISNIDFEGKSVLDIGCGMGDIIPYIEAKTNNFNYTGIDLLPEFTDSAKKNYPNYEFIAGDYKKLIKPADIIICSGALNTNIPNAIEERKEAVSLMFDYSNEILAFNMAGYHPQPKNKESYIVYYVDSLEFLEFCLTLTSKVIFKQGYAPKDFTIVIFKQ